MSICSCAGGVGDGYMLELSDSGVHGLLCKIYRSQTLQTAINYLD